MPPHYLGVAYAVRSVVGFGAGVVSPFVFGLGARPRGRRPRRERRSSISTDAFAWGIAWSTLGLGAFLGPVAIWSFTVCDETLFRSLRAQSRAYPRRPQARLQGLEDGARDRIGHGPARRLLRRGVAAPEVLAGDQRRLGVFGQHRHIMSWPQVELMFAGVASMGSLRIFALYGPFQYGGRATSQSNARFDAMLRSRDPESGVRDFEHIRALAGRCGLAHIEDNAMPANNRLLVFRKEN